MCHIGGGSVCGAFNLLSVKIVAGDGAQDVSLGYVLSGVRLIDLGVMEIEGPGAFGSDR
jgi:hypothetical protein